MKDSSTYPAHQTFKDRTRVGRSLPLDDIGVILNGLPIYFFLSNRTLSKCTRKALDFQVCITFGILFAGLPCPLWVLYNKYIHVYINMEIWIFIFLRHLLQDNLSNFFIPFIYSFSFHFLLISTWDYILYSLPTSYWHCSGSKILREH